MHATDQQTISEKTCDIRNQLPAQVQRFPSTVSRSFHPSKIRSLAKPCHPIPCQINRKKAKSVARIDPPIEFGPPSLGFSSCTCNLILTTVPVLPVLLAGSTKIQKDWWVNDWMVAVSCHNPPTVGAPLAGGDILPLSEQMERALLMEKLGNDTWSSGSV
jgi:hypothetical protein